MALSGAQKQEILFYLGYPAKTIVTGSTHFSNTINSRMLNLDADIEARVAEILEALATTDARLGKAGCRLSAKRVDEIELNPDEIDKLRSERRRLARMLAEYLDIPLKGGGGMNVGICI